MSRGRRQGQVSCSFSNKPTVNENVDKVKQRQGRLTVRMRAITRHLFVGEAGIHPDRLVRGISHAHV